MNKFALTGIKIRIAKPKKARVNSCPKRISNKIFYGIVIEPDDGKYKIAIRTDEKGINKQILNFTQRSFDLYGKRDIFTIKKDENGRRTRVIRDVWKAKFAPGFSEYYTPFTKNWIVKGYLVKDGPITLFDFKELVGLNRYDVNIENYNND